ncbi:hypothetical protein [Gemella morbillorum]
MNKLREVANNIRLTSAIILALLKGGGNMMIKILVANILDGLMTLDQIKNKKLRKLVEAELRKMGLTDVIDENQGA